MEHCCGPTREQVNGALMRGEVFGTWERCDECAQKEKEFWDKYGSQIFLRKA